jgi:hypothetical protein
MARAHTTAWFSRMPRHDACEQAVAVLELAVDQQFGEGARLGVSPVGADPVGRSKSGHQDVEQFGAGSKTEGVQALPESALEFIGSYQVSAFAACSAMVWTACSRIWRSLRPREGVGVDPPLLSYASQFLSVSEPFPPLQVS